MVKLSVLDLANIGEGFTPADALDNALDLAQHAEAAGYSRFWLAEHHNLAGIASAATAVCICHVAGGTSTIRVGAGGIMLPNHSPMVIAEQFGTLALLFPDRIDLGLGRAPGTDQRTWQALRRDFQASDRFPQDVVELQPCSALHAKTRHSTLSLVRTPTCPYGSLVLAFSAHSSLPCSACLMPSPRTSHPRH